MDCVIYTRVSTERQGIEGHSLEYQLERIRNWIEDEDHNEVDDNNGPFTDTMSGYLDVTRERFEAMKKFVVKENIKLIVCWEISRFGRSSIRSQQAILDYSKLGVNIHFVDSDLDTLHADPYKNFQLRTLFNMADFHRDLLMSQFGGGRETALRDGKRIAMPKVPYGIAFDEEGFIIPHPEEAKWVKRIFEWYLSGDSYGVIANRLEDWEPPIPTKRGGEWRSSIVKSILLKEIHTGYRKVKRPDPKKYGEKITIEVALNWEDPTISTEDFKKVQKIIEKRLNIWHRDRHVRSTKETHKFKGKTFCGHCGRPCGTMSEVLPTNEGDKILYAYRCSGVSKKTCNDLGQFHTQMFDNCCMTMMLGSENYITYLTDDDKRKQALDEITADQKRIKGVLSTMDDRKRMAYDNAKYRKASEIWYKQEIAKINTEKDTLTDKYKKLESRRQTYYKNRDLLKMLFLKNDSIDPDKIKKLVERVDVYNVMKWDFKWKELPKEYKWISYRQKDSKFNVSVLDRGFNKTPYGSTDKVLYIELFFFSYDVPEKAVISTVSKNVYVGDRLKYDEKTKNLSLTTQTA